MAIIGKVKQPVYSPVQSRAAMITNIKMEISKVHQKEKYGQISQQEAQMQLALLEAKLSALESGQSIDGVQFEVPDSINPNAPVVVESEQFGFENNNNNENNDSQQKQDSFFEQQAMYNRLFHNI